MWDYGLFVVNNGARHGNSYGFYLRLDIPNRDATRRASAKVSHVIGSCLVNHDIIARKARVNLNSRLTRDRRRSVELAVLEFNILGCQRALIIDQHRLAGAVEGAVLEQDAASAVSPDVVSVTAILLESAVDELHIVGIQELLAGDGAVLVGQLAGVLEALVSLVGKFNRHALEGNTCRVVIELALHVNDGALGADDGDILVFQRRQGVGAVLLVDQQ